MPTPWPNRPMFIGFKPFPPEQEWRDYTELAAVRTLPRDQPLTAAELRAHGVRLRMLPFEGSL